MAMPLLSYIIPWAWPRLVDTRSGGLCRLSESVFEVDRVHHSEGRMASASVVDSLDPVADAELGGCLGRPQVPVVELDFQYGPNDSYWALSQHTAVRPTERTRLCSRANRASCAEVYWQPRSACNTTCSASSPRIATAIATAA